MGIGEEFHCRAKTENLRLILSVRIWVFWTKKTIAAKKKRTRTRILT
jgi:hypothetical protein